MVEVAAAVGFLALAAAGALARWWLSTRRYRRWFRGLPVPTLAVNVGGSFLLGCLVGADIDAQVLTVIGTGFLGSFTTFSTFARETHSLVAASDRRRALAYAGLSLGLGVSAALAGLAVYR